MEEILGAVGAVSGKATSIETKVDAANTTLGARLSTGGRAARIKKLAQGTIVFGYASLTATATVTGATSANCVVLPTGSLTAGDNLSTCTARLSWAASGGDVVVTATRNSQPQDLTVSFVLIEFADVG